MSPGNQGVFSALERGDLGYSPRLFGAVPLALDKYIRSDLLLLLAYLICPLVR